MRGELVVDDVSPLEAKRLDRVPTAVSVWRICESARHWAETAVAMPCESSAEDEPLNEAIQRMHAGHWWHVSENSAPTPLPQNHCDRERQISDLLHPGCVDCGCQVDVVVGSFDCSEGRT
jgi:hypothetical protein